LVSIGFELEAPFEQRMSRRLEGAIKQARANHQVVDRGRHETAIGIGRLQTIGSPRTLKDVLTSTGTPVFRLNASITWANASFVLRSTV